jgi:hypothetical protein
MSIITGIALRFAIASFFGVRGSSWGGGGGRGGARRGTCTGVQRMSWCGRTGSLERQMGSSHESIDRTDRCSWNGLIWAAFDVFSIWHTRRKTKAFRVLKPNENHFTTRSTRSGPERTTWSCSNLMGANAFSSPIFRCTIDLVTQRGLVAADGFQVSPCNFCHPVRLSCSLISPRHLVSKGGGVSSYPARSACKIRALLP